MQSLWHQSWQRVTVVRVGSSVYCSIVMILYMHFLTHICLAMSVSTLTVILINTFSFAEMKGVCCTCKGVDKEGVYIE